MTGPQVEDADEIADVEEIQFDNVALSHGDSARPVVHGLNFKITFGLKLAIVGRSGSGKSTIVESLLGILFCCSDVADTKKSDTNIVGYQRVGFRSVRIV